MLINGNVPQTVALKSEMRESMEEGRSWPLDTDDDVTKSHLHTKSTNYFVCIA